jgi:enamine deaminase RidA (YjgF/YER057c/UK114 family)
MMSSGSSANSHPQTDYAVTHGAGCLEISLTLRPLGGEGMMELFGRLAATLKELDATIAALIIFGSTRASAAATEGMRRVFGAVDWPVTWVEGVACDGGAIAGIQVFAFAGDGLRRIVLDGRVVGSVFEDDSARHCVLGGLGPVRQGLKRSAQTSVTFQRMSEALGQAGLSLADVVRTWFYLDDLLAWYGEFNEVRNLLYAGIDFRSGSSPASTGISGGNPAGTALVAGAWAVRPLNASTRIEEVASPLQCPAPAYGSAFSRAMEMISKNGRRLWISGTASVAPGGQTLWPGDLAKQIDLTLDVVDAILRSRGFEFTDLTRATAYFKNPADAARLSEACAARRLRPLPLVSTGCGICRPDLLFELEADAWTPGPFASSLEFAI